MNINGALIHVTNTWDVLHCCADVCLVTLSMQSYPTKGHCDPAGLPLCDLHTQRHDMLQQRAQIPRSTQGAPGFHYSLFTQIPQIVRSAAFRGIIPSGLKSEPLKALSQGT